MITLTLNDDVLRWDCDTLQVSFNDEVKEFDSLWEMEEYLDHTYGVLLVDEESLVDETLH